MAVYEGRTGLELLTPDRCWELLASERIGRIALVGPDGPEIFPINFTVDHRSVVFRTDPGTKLRAAQNYSAVAFEVDNASDSDARAWSVVVKGSISEVHSPDELDRLRSLDLQVWAPGEKYHWMRLSAVEITGRAITPRG